MTEYIERRGLLPGALMTEVWAKWSAPERPSVLRDNPEAACPERGRRVADVVLFNEVRHLVALCAAQGDVRLTPRMR